MSGQVVHVFSAPPQAVFVGRPSLFGNPFKLPPQASAEQRQAVIAHYRVWLYRRVVTQPEFAEQVRQLHGHTLACFCAPLPCHGQVLLAAAAWLQGVSAQQLAARATRLPRAPRSPGVRVTSSCAPVLVLPAAPPRPHLDEQALEQFAAAEALTEQQARADSEADRYTPGAYYAGPHGLIGLWEPEPDPDAKVPQCVECGSQSQARLSRAGLCQMCVDSWKLYGRVRFTRAPATV